MDLIVARAGVSTPLDHAIQWNMFSLRLAPFPVPNESRIAPIEPLVAAQTYVALDTYKSAITLVNIPAGDYRKVRLYCALSVLTRAMAHSWIVRSDSCIPLSIHRVSGVVITQSGAGVYPESLIQFLLGKAKGQNPFNWSLIIPLVIPGHVVLFAPVRLPTEPNSWQTEPALLWLRDALSGFAERDQLRLIVTEFCGETIRSSYQAADIVKMEGKTLDIAADGFKKTIPVNIEFARKTGDDISELENRCKAYLRWLETY